MEVPIATTIKNNFAAPRRPVNARFAPQTTDTKAVPDPLFLASDSRITSSQRNVFATRFA
jgi:hypothetical protein